MEIIHKQHVAELILRVFCGIIFLYQGYDKLFKVKIKGVTDAFQINAQKNNIPHFMLYGAAVYTSVVEFFGGLLLILGLFKGYVLTLLGLDLILVGIAFSMLEPVWDMRHVFPRLVMVVALMLLPHDWDILSLDYLLFNK
ncbi:MAG: DoxX family membrane protein [Bacteroidia bacterium]|nr:DoxX family membrane protein [Bacteroidia bacterium]